MKGIAAFVLFAGVVVSPDLRYFPFDRPLQLSSESPSRTCLVADAALFAHAAEPDLADLRLYHDRTETPYFIQTATVPLATVGKTIPVLNLGLRNGETVFDSEMQTSAYSDLAIQASGRDFIAPVTVSGSQTQTGPTTKIGRFTIFDLTSQKLGRSTVLHLPQSDFRFLHFVVGGPVRPDQVTGLLIEGSGSASASYVDVAATEHVGTKGRTTVAEFTVPAHVPVDRIEIVPEPTPANFSREVAVRTGSPDADAALTSQNITGYGSILRVHTVQDSHRLDLERLTIQTSRAQVDRAAKWTITIDNGDDAPFIPRQVKLQMLERDLCFEGAPNGKYTLYYGDPALNAPHYDLGQVVGFQFTNSAHATAGAEEHNAEYEPRPDSRPFTDRHPSLLWIALILVIGVLGGVAYRTAQGTLPRTP